MKSESEQMKDFERGSDEAPLRGAPPGSESDPTGQRNTQEKRQTHFLDGFVFSLDDPRKRIVLLLSGIIKLLTGIHKKIYNKM